MCPRLVKLEMYKENADCSFDLKSVVNPKDEAIWHVLSQIKSNILKRLDSAPASIKVCCIRFVQCVVYTQTPAVILDPRVRFLNSSESANLSNMVLID